MIFYAINMISYTLKRFTIQLIDFVNNLLSPVEGFNRYQIFGKKKVARGSRTRASAIRKLRVPLRYTVLSVGLAAKALKYKYFSSLRHRFWLLTGALGTFQLPPVVALRYQVELSPGAFGLPKAPGGLQTGALGPERHWLILSPGT